MTTDALPGAQNSARAARAAWRARWAAMAPRERLAVGLMGALIALALLYLVAIRPAWQVVRDAPTRIASLDAQLQHMQRLAVDSKELRGTPRMPPSQAAAALKSATDAMGTVGRLTVTGDRATLTLTNANGDQLRRWLIDARSAARARPVEATLSREPGGYSGSVVVALPTP